MGKKAAYYATLPGFVTEMAAEYSTNPADSWVLVDRERGGGCFLGNGRWMVICPKDETARGTCFPNRKQAEEALSLFSISAEAAKDALAKAETKRPITRRRNESASVALQRALEQEFPPEEIAEWARELREASRTVPVGKDDEGNTEYEEVPDYTVRLQGLRLVLEYQVGKPVQRSETVVRAVKSADQILESIKADPEYRDKLQGYLDDASAIDVEGKVA